MVKSKDYKSGFKFTDANLIEVNKQINKYPKGRQASAIIAILDLAQRQDTRNNYVSRAAMIETAKILNLPLIRVVEVAHFYTMINTKPCGRYHLQLCSTTPCWLCGSDDIKQTIKDELGIETGQTTDDNLFTLSEVECLGACDSAPIIQINDDYYCKITQKELVSLLRKLRDEASRNNKVQSNISV